MQATRRHVLTGATALAVALVGVPLVAPAGASLRASNGATSTQAVSSATWSAIPTLTPSGAPAPGTVSIEFSRTLIVTTAPQYFYVANTGTRALVGTSYTVTGIAGALLGNPVITLRACVGGTWNTSSDACTGTGAVDTVVGTFTAGAPGPVQSAVVAAAPGSRLHLQASVSNFGLLGSFTAVFGASVTSTGPRQVSGPLTTNT